MGVQVSVQTAIKTARKVLEAELDTATPFDARDLRVRLAYLKTLDAALPAARHYRVFVSYQAADRRYFDVLTEKLKDSPIEILTGFHDDEGADSVTDTVLASLSRCCVYLGILTPDRNRAHTFRKSVPSPWTVVEQGMAIALAKPYVMMIHKNVNKDFCIDRGRQHIPFNDKNFDKAVGVASRRVIRMCDTIARQPV